VTGDVDTCDMPIGSHARCVLPGDHEDGCHAGTCLCSHDIATQHDEVGCRIFVCGCRVARSKGSAA
jgi:hypothetical protein